MATKDTTAHTLQTTAEPRHWKRNPILNFRAEPAEAEAIREAVDRIRLPHFGTSADPPGMNPQTRLSVGAFMRHAALTLAQEIIGSHALAADLVVAYRIREALRCNKEGADYVPLPDDPGAAKSARAPKGSPESKNLALPFAKPAKKRPRTLDEIAMGDEAPSDAEMAAAGIPVIYSKTPKAKKAAKPASSSSSSRTTASSRSSRSSRTSTASSSSRRTAKAKPAPSAKRKAKKPAAVKPKAKKRGAK